MDEKSTRRHSSASRQAPETPRGSADLSENKKTSQGSTQPAVASSTRTGYTETGGLSSLTTSMPKKVTCEVGSKFYRRVSPVARKIPRTRVSYQGPGRQGEEGQPASDMEKLFARPLMTRELVLRPVCWRNSERDTTQQLSVPLRRLQSSLNVHSTSSAHSWQIIQTCRSCHC